MEKKNANISRNNTNITMIPKGLHTNNYSNH